MSIKAKATDYTQFTVFTAAKTDDDVFIKAVPSKSRVYVGEPITIEFLLYSRVPIIDPQHELTVKFDNAFVDEYPFQNELRNELINGQMYQVVLMKKYLIIPQLAGKLKVPAATKIFKINEPPSPDDFFGIDRIIEKKITSLPKTLDVLPLPALVDSIPFSEAIGEFKASSNFKVSDQSSAVLTFNLKVSGKGSLKFSNLKLPELPDDVVIYNEDQKNDYSLKAKSLQSNATFTYKFFANFQGEYIIPAITFLYFNPETGHYERYVSAPFKWHVRDGALKQISQVKALGKNEKSFNGLFLKGELTKLNTQLFIHTPAFNIILMLSAFLFAAGFLYTYWSDKVAANEAQYVFERAKKKAIRSLRKQKRDALVLDHDRFYKRLIESATLYFCSKFDLPSDSFTLIVLQDKLSCYKLPEKLENEVMMSMRDLYAARFSLNQELVNDRYAQCDQLIALIKTVDKYLYEEADLKPAMGY